MPIPRTLNHAFFKIWSHDMAYVLGFFAADGSMIGNKRGAHFIEFHITDRDLLEDIQKVLASNHKISVRIRNKKWKVGYRLQIGSKEMFEDLLGLGFTPNKSKTLRFPKIPKKFLGDFVRGYFDGDGCVYFKEHWRKDRQKMRWIFSSRFTCGSLHFLKDLHKSLKEDIVQKGFIISVKGGYNLVFSHLDGLALYRFMYNNSHCSIYLRRKKAIFEKAINTLGYLDKYLRP